MEISSYTSNIPPHGVSGGTKIASNNESGKQVSSTSTEGVPSKQEFQDSQKAVEQTGEVIRARQEANEQELETLMEQMNDFMDSISTGLSFRLDDDTGRNIITIYEAKTGDIIKQIPSEDMLEILKRLSSDSGGLITESV